VSPPSLGGLKNQSGPLSFYGLTAAVFTAGTK